MQCPVCRAENPSSVAACQQCGAPLGTHAHAPASHILPAGTALMGGAYTVAKVLGQGGFGITYLGSDTGLRRPVAIKECFPQGSVRQRNAVQPAGGMTLDAFQETCGKFLEEAQMLALCQHPNIVQVYTSFLENNTAYIVMEFLKGKDLGALLRERGALPEREAVAHVERVGEALEVVHGKGLLHRDIKPENIMLTGEGRVVLLDFGTARAFAAGRTRRMTSLLTPGYAPLEQYGQEARFGKFTDVYALGATLYHLLAGQAPVQATDRAAGVTLPPPCQLNSRISRTVSDAVAWAMEVKVDERPQTVRDFLGALRGTPRTTTTGSGTRQQQPEVRTPFAPANPYEAQIQEIQTELTKPFTMPPGRHDGRINEISGQIAALARSAAGQSRQCPACRQSDLYQVTGQAAGQCPLCRAGRLTTRFLDPEKCAVCRSGSLTLQKASGGSIFCPICRAALLQKERRKRFGLALDLWWICPHCSAAFDVLMDGRARLAQCDRDPYGVGAQQMGQTLPVAEWARIAERADAYWACDACQAQFDAVDQHRLKLVGWTADPHGVGKQYGGKTLFQSAWAKVAASLPLAAGNTRCPQCKAEFDCDSGGQTMTLLQFGANAPEWAKSALGKPAPAQSWHLAAAGKRSMQPGWICRSCSVEFDADKGLLRLVAAPSGVLSPFAQRSYMLEDWQRLTAGLPTRAQEKQIREELARLQQEKQQEQEQAQQAERDRRARLKADLTQLFKRSLIEGFVLLRQQTASISLRQSEALRWESHAFKLRQRVSQGHRYWDIESEGTLLVTNERILLQSAGKIWNRPLSKLVAVECQRTQGTAIVVAGFDGLQSPVGFAVRDATWTDPGGGQSLTVTLTAQDLGALLEVLIQNRR